MLGLSICWRGPPGSGKRHALQQQLQMWAASIGQHYVLKTQIWDAPTQTNEEEEEDEKVLPMEISLLHWGFDCARMSLEDKKYLKCILPKWGRGGQVLAQQHTQRCLVFYHAHLLSSESILYLQAFLEENYQDTVLWLTSEYPLPSRLSDWCVEIPVSKGAAQRDQSYDILVRGAPAATNALDIPTLQQEIQKILELWMTKPATLSDVYQVRAIVYALLHRNIRWTEGFHQWMFALESIPLTPAQRLSLAKLCVRQPFTGSGQTVPSYRIPILWENYLLGIRTILSPLPQPSEELPQKKKKASKHATAKASSSNP